MKIIFTKNKSFFSYAIRLFTWSRWHHCGIVDQGHVLEASFKNGVVKTPIDEFLSRYTKYEYAELRGDVTKAYKEVGKPYDISAIFGILFRKKGWDNPNKWFCSELIAHCTTLFREGKVSRVTPEHVYMVSKTIEK